MAEASNSRQTTEIADSLPSVKTMDQARPVGVFSRALQAYIITCWASGFTYFMLLNGRLQMRTWQTETSIYLTQLESVLSQMKSSPPHPGNIPFGPLDSAPSLLQSAIHRAVTFYEFAVWHRSREMTEAIIILWREGYLSSAAALARLLFEIWGASHYMTNALRIFAQDNELARLSLIIDRLFEGARSEVLLPWGTPANEKPIHVLDTIRSLGKDFPEAMAVYEDLCESAHANQPRFLEWWCLGKAGDNWTNKTVKTRGHALIKKTVEAIERSFTGIKTEAEMGIKLCGDLY